MNYAIYSFGHTSTVNLALAIQNKLEFKDYAYNYLYHGLIFIPLGYIYTKGQNKLRGHLFDYFTPYQLNNFSLMYFVSKPALLFDVVFNHIGFQSLVFISLYQFCSHFYTIKPKNESSSSKFVDLLKIRLFLSTFSILTDLWLPQINLYKQNLAEDPKEIIFSKKTKFINSSKNALIAMVWQTAIIQTYLKQNAQ